jgi:hypothetical protein
LVLLVSAAWAARQWWPKPAPSVSLPIGPSPTEEAAALFQAAKNLAREGKWAEAKLKLLAAQSLDPDLASLGTYLARAGQEVPNEEHLRATQIALDQEQLGLAAAELNQVSAVNSSSGRSHPAGVT